MKRPFQKVQLLVAGWQSTIFHSSAVWPTGHYTAVQLSSFYPAPGVGCKSWNFVELFPISLDGWATPWLNTKSATLCLQCFCNAASIFQNIFSKMWQHLLLAVSTKQLFLCAVCWPPKRSAALLSSTEKTGSLFSFRFTGESFLLGSTCEAALFFLSLFFFYERGILVAQPAHKETSALPHQEHIRSPLRSFFYVHHHY